MEVDCVAATMASLTHMATLVRMQEVLMLGWINTGCSNVAEQHLKNVVPHSSSVEK